MLCRSNSAADLVGGTGSDSAAQNRSSWVSLTAFATAQTPFKPATTSCPSINNNLGHILNGPFCVSSSASRAAEFGAVAALVRSATGLAMQIPHTGEMAYDPRYPKIPAAAISPEDAMMIARFYADRVPVRVHLQMSAHMLPDADSTNVIGEIPGREHPEQVVVIGGHIDSWDVARERRTMAHPLLPACRR